MKKKLSDRKAVNEISDKLESRDYCDISDKEILESIVDVLIDFGYVTDDLEYMNYR